MTALDWVPVAILAATNLVAVTLGYARLKEHNVSLGTRLAVIEDKLGNGKATYARAREVEIVQEATERRIARLELLVQVEKPD